MTLKPFPLPHRDRFALFAVQFIFGLLIALCSTLGVFAQQYSVSDDYFILDGPLYAGNNDHPIAAGGYNFVTWPTHGNIVWYDPYGSILYNPHDLTYTGSDTLSYKNCGTIYGPNGPEYGVCTNTATVIIERIGSYDGMNFGSCKLKKPNAPPPPPSNAGQPVNVTNGNMWLEQTDYSLPGIGEPIGISRFYNSRSESSGLFGFGWSTAYDEYLTVYDDNMVRLNLPDAKGVFFGRPNTTSPFVSISPDVTAQIVKNADNTYTLTFQDGRVHKFDAVGRLQWQRDRNGNQTTLTYDVNYVLTSITDAVGRTLTITPITNGKEISDSMGFVARYEYDPTGVFLQTVTYADDSKYKFEYVNKVVNGQTKTYLATVKDALNNILETHEYDTQGRATTSEKHGGVEKYTFTYNGGQTIVTDALGHTTKYWYYRKQGKNYITQTEGVCSCGGGGSENTWYEYDFTNLNLIRKTDALGRQTSYEYDASGNVKKQIDVLGTETYTHNSFGEILTRTDRMGGVTTNTYSATGNLLTSKDALNFITTLTYTTLGQLETIKDALNHTTTLTYDAFGRLTQVKDANNKNTNIAYDARVRPTSVTNALSETTSFEYDLNNRLKKVIYPDTNFTENTYDLAGRRTAVKDARGNTTTYGYDGAYRMTSMTDPLNHTSSVVYDLMSNVISQDRCSRECNEFRV
jgi:YD repeat-containing protein